MGIQRSLNDSNLVSMTSTVFTPSEQHFNALLSFLESDNFTLSVQEEFSAIDGIVIESVDAMVLDNGLDNGDSGDGEGDDDSDDSEWYEFDWSDPLSYAVLQYVVCGLALFVLLFCCGIALWCVCCKNAKEESNPKGGGSFMNNPHRYDSEFPGAEMQNFQPAGKTTSNGATFVE